MKSAMIENLVCPVSPALRIVGEAAVEVDAGEPTRNGCSPA